MKITVETRVKASMDKIWFAWNNPGDIRIWNTASADWHTTKSDVDLRVGGKFLARMEAKDRSAGFDFEGTYTRIDPEKLIEYKMDDGREVRVEFVAHHEAIHLKETFDAEAMNSPEVQRAGWQAILDNFRKHVEKDG